MTVYTIGSLQGFGPEEPGWQLSASALKLEVSVIGLVSILRSIELPRGEHTFHVYF